MTTIRLLREVLISTVAAVCVCAALGYVISFPLGLVLHSEAASFRFFPKGGRSIETKKLEALEHMQEVVVGVGAMVGLLSAQSVFLVKHLRPKTDSD